MDIAIEVWNLLWDYQIEVAFVIVLLIWIVVRGSDVMRWLGRKVHRKDNAATKSPEK